MSIHRRFTLVWVSKYGRARELGGPLIWCSAAVLAFLMSLVAWNIGSTYGAAIFRSGKLAHMVQENQRLIAQIQNLQRKTAASQSHLDELVLREQSIRIVAGLPDIHPDIRRIGVGGPPDAVGGADGLGSVGILIVATLDSLQRQQRIADLVLASLQEITAKTYQNKNYWQHIPTIRPLIGATASPYGMREDPFTGFSSMHFGIDIVGRPNALVKATADGVVLRIGIDAKYGNYLDIDHGNGYLTRYAHLSSIATIKDMPVKRGEVIGYVGKTGRATGYHVHYEVILERRRINPIDHFFSEDLIFN